MLKRLKKGFTLAELLIVVAIIAVLTAIAVPLFVTALSDAKKNTQTANIAAVREAAVAYILTADKTTEGLYENGELVDGPFYASAKVSSSGDVTELKVSTTATTVGWTKDAATEDTSTGGYTVTVQITNVKGEFA